jgi:hypothetical protein
MVTHKAGDKKLCEERARVLQVELEDLINAGFEAGS